jgi:DNA polymerase I-like protein with 3'-5' exonuclease and polymerase domains
MNIYTIDFETLPIVSGSSSTPEPIGVSIKFNSNPSCYYDFDDENTLEYLISIVDKPDNMLVYHNAAFDVRVQFQNMGIRIPYHRIYDTMIAAFIIDPREDSLGLKELAQKYCGIPNTEQDELQQWLKDNHHKHYDIYLAPFDLVKKYAEKDTDMTYALYLYQQQWLSNLTDEQRQHTLAAFKREMLLLPIVIDIQMNGVYISPDIQHTADELEVKFDSLTEKLKAYGNDEEPGTKAFFNALVANGHINKANFKYTAKGNVQFGREVLPSYIDDEELLESLEIRSRLQKLLSTYVRPYAQSAQDYNGKFYPWLSQTRGADDYGTRTGRFSGNLQQLPREPKDDSLPFVRSFIVCKPGHIFLKRDISSQEIRIAAHYADGNILRAFNENPNLDVHKFSQDTILEKTGLKLDRATVKTISFLKMYGGGRGLLAEKLGVSFGAASSFFDAYDMAFPELKQLTKDVENMSRGGQPIRTWGGRYYLAEPPKDGKDYFYKMANVLIQGSAADQLKQAMVRYHYHLNKKGRIVLCTHDEILVEVLEEHKDSEMALLKWAINEMDGWDLPMLSEGFTGYNYGELEEYVDL